MKIGSAFQKIARSLTNLPQAIAQSPLAQISAKAFSPLAALKNSLGIKGLPKLFSSRPFAFERPAAAPLSQVLPPSQIGDLLGRTLALKQQGADPRLDSVANLFQLLGQLQTLQPARVPDPRW